MRRTTYWTRWISLHSTGMASAPSSTKWPIRAPPAKSTTPAMSVNIIAAERSGSTQASRSSNPMTRRKGSSPFVRRRNWSFFFTTSIAVQTTTAIFASSDG
jgi:hypothetical protein